MDNELFSTKIKINVKEAQSSLMSLENRLVKTADKTKQLSEELNEIGSKNVMSDEYRQLTLDLAKAEKEMRKLTEASEKMAKSKKTTDRDWEEYANKYNANEARMHRINSRMAEMERNGTDMVAGTDTDAYRKTRTKLEYAKNEQAIAEEKIREYNAKAEEKAEREKAKRKEQIAKENARRESAIREKALAIGNKGAGIIKNSGKKMGNLFNKMFMAGIGVRSVFALMRKIASYAKEGLHNLAQYSKAYNENMSALKSASATLKNNLATVAEPIINAIVPALTTVINYLNTASNKVSELMANLAGKSTFTKAKQQVIDYAQTLETAKSNLASFDDVNVLSQDKSGGELKGADAFEEAEVTASSFADGLKDALKNGDWDEVGTLFAEKINGAVNNFDASALALKISNKINDALHLLEGFLTNLDFRGIGTKVGTFLSDGITNIDMGSIAHSLSAIVIGFWDMLSGAIEAVDWASLGTKVATFIKEIDWAGILSSAWEFVGAVIGAGCSLILNFMKEMFSDAIEGLCKWWRESAFDENGDFDLKGLLEALKDKLGSMWEWLKDNVFEPLADGFVKAFGMDNLGEAVSSLELVCTTIENVFIDMWNNIANVFNTGATLLEEFLNSAIDDANKVLSANGANPYAVQLSHVSIGRMQTLDSVGYSTPSPHSSSSHLTASSLSGITATQAFRDQTWYNVTGDVPSSVSTVVLQLDGQTLGKVTLPYIQNASRNIGTVLSNRGSSVARP